MTAREPPGRSGRTSEQRPEQRRPSGQHYDGRSQERDGGAGEPAGERPSQPVPTAASSIHPVVLGTAGHIDHGKTALVKALTGIDTDRLKEEQRRGITIELGFAHLEIGGRRFGFVDVPGHERFIKSMVAGAAGVDIVLLVVAADEGVMPQTREHLEICQLLGVQRGLIALSKADLVEPEWLGLVRDDLRAAVRGTFLEGAPVVPCSAATRAGLDELRRALLALAGDLRPRDAGGLLRLPLDRVFTMHGFGTVVTGTMLSGSLRQGEEVVILPAGATAKVRGLQVHGRPVETSTAGQRTAVNLGGIDRQAIERGEVLARPGTLTPSPMIDVLLELLPNATASLPARARLLFHLGTRQQEGVCVLLDRSRLAPGEAAVAQLRFEAPVVALPGDRFIVRGFARQPGHGTTIGGGRVIRVLSRRLRPRDRAAIDLLRRMVAATSGTQRMELELLAAGAAGMTRAALQQRLPQVPAAVEAHLASLVSAGRAVCFDPETAAVIHEQHLASLAARTREILAEHHRRHPLDAGMNREELRSRLSGAVGPRLYRTVLLASGVLVERESCRLPDHQPRLSTSAVRPLAERVLLAYEEAGLAPPWDSELAARLGALPGEIGQALKLLLDEGVLLRAGTLYFARGPLEALRQRLVAFLEQQGAITPTQFKELVGQSRKYVIPLAEHFDAQRVTLRVGEVRRLRRP